MICICVNFVAKYVDKQDPESNAIVVFVERKQPLQTIPNLTEPYLLLSDISSALLTFNDSLAFLTVICFHFLNKKLKCHLCHSFDNTWLRYPLAQSLLDYQLQFGWINLLDVRQECNPIRPFDSSSEILFVCLFVFPSFLFFLFSSCFDIHCGVLGGPREISGWLLFATLPFVFHPTTNYCFNVF